MEVDKQGPICYPVLLCFGSQSDAGAKTREVMMTVLHTLKKRSDDPTGALKNILDQLAKDIKTDPFNIIYPANTS